MKSKGEKGMKKDVENKKKIQITGFPKTAFMKKQDMDALVSLFYSEIKRYYEINIRENKLNNVSEDK